MNKKSHQVLNQFRYEIYQVLQPARDAVFETIDAIATSPLARSAVEVSLSPHMERKYSSVYKGLTRSKVDAAKLRPILVKYAERQGELVIGGAAVYALDHSPYPRKHAPTVSDRGMVHGVDGPVIGHQYSLLGRVWSETGSWVGVVDCQRIATAVTPTKVGAAQIKELKQTTQMEVIITADSEYLTEAVLDEADARTHLLIRMKGNRKLFGRPAARRPGQRGAPAIHGQKLKLNQANCLPTPEVQMRVEEEDGSWVVISVWPDLHVATRPKTNLCAVRVEMFKTNGERRFQRPLWLAWTGSSDQDWSTFWRVYLKRFCIEAVHQFTKNSLSWTRARLGSTVREERWSWLVMLAYWQLILAAPLSRDCYRPWEKPMPSGKSLTPGRVQRDFGRILLVVGTPTRTPKVRGIPPGRPTGRRPTPRLRFEIIIKAKKTAKKAKEVKPAA